MEIVELDKDQKEHIIEKWWNRNNKREDENIFVIFCSAHEMDFILIYWFVILIKIRKIMIIKKKVFNKNMMQIKILFLILSMKKVKL